MPATIIDNGGSGYTELSGSWATASSQGYGGSVRFASTAGASIQYAFTGLSAGVKTVGYTWTQPGGSRDTATAWTVYDSDGTTVLGTGTIDQSATFGDFASDGAAFKSLGAFTITGTALTLKLVRGNNFLIADAAVVRTPVATTGSAAAGSVEYLADDYSTYTIDQGFSGSFKAGNLYDADPETLYANLATGAGWAAIDLGSGVSAQATAILWMPPPLNTDYYTVNCIAEGCATLNGTWTSLGTLALGFVRAINSLAIAPGSAYRFYRLRNATTGELLELSEIGLVGPPATGMRCRPCRPALSPGGGNVASGTSCTITCATTNASIYYTTDGTTPDNTKTLYAGPFTVPNGTPTTVKAIAYRSDCDSVYSAVVATKFIAPAQFIFDTGSAPPWSGATGGTTKFAPVDWHDDTGVPIEAHAGDLRWDSVLGKYVLIGSPACGTAGDDHGFVAYSSSTGEQWHYEGQILPNPPSGWGLGAQPSITRAHVGYNASASNSNKKYVLYCHADASNFTKGYCGIATAPAALGPWTWAAGGVNPNSELANDSNLFIDPDNGERWYVYAASNTSIHAGRLDSTTDYTSFDGTFVTLHTGAREGIVLFKRSGTYFLITSALSGYGAGVTSVSYKAAAGANLSAVAATLAAASFATLWATTPATSDVAYNAQPTGICPAQGRTDSWFLLFDWWDAGAATVDLNRARLAWQPLKAANFPTSTTLSITPQASWTLSTFPSAGGAFLPAFCSRQPMIGTGVY